MSQATRLAPAVLAAVGLISASLFASAAGAQVEFTSYEAQARAEGVRISVSAPNFVAVETFIDGGGPVSQATIDGLGNSQAFASSPYPGDLFLTGPGTVAGLTGLPSPPAYPFHVSSSYPTTEEASVTQPGYELQATSNEYESSSSATTGGVQGDSAAMFIQGTSSVQRDIEANEIVSEAAVTADIINIAGVLKIASGQAHAKAVRSASGELTRESSLVLRGVSIADQPVGFSDKGFTTPGNDTPLPDDSPLRDALAQAGITVRYLKGVETENGVVSPGFVITQEFQVPEGPLMVFSYVIGRATATATVS